jgi:hypothetical protein
MVTKKKDKEKMPHVEANDLSPILTPHLDDQQTAPSPPKKSPAPRKAKTKEKIREEKFNIEIANVIRLERRAEWRELIQETPCFAKLWRDPDTDEYCEHVDCDLRQLCQGAWTSVVGGLEADEKPPTEPWSPRSKRKKVGRPRKESKVVKRAKWKGTGKYNRHGYQDMGRPVDLFARALWEFLGQPESLPDSWQYPVSKDREQRDAAPKIFIKEYGGGLYVTRRASYHQYLFEGKHLMRFWVNAGGGGWLDCSALLARALAKSGKIDLVRSPESGYKTKFRFYPHRMFVGRERDVDQIKEALNRIEGLVK